MCLESVGRRGSPEEGQRRGVGPKASAPQFCLGPKERRPEAEAEVAAPSTRRRQNSSARLRVAGVRCGERFGASQEPPKCPRPGLCLLAVLGQVPSPLCCSNAPAVSLGVSQPRSRCAIASGALGEGTCEGLGAPDSRLALPVQPACQVDLLRGGRISGGR